MVKDISPGFLTSVSDALFFAADDGSHGRELWTSDGTPEGTVMVKDINPGSGSSLPSPARLKNVNGALFFGASDGSNGTELWKSDGTLTGTVMVADINPGSGSSSPNRFVLSGTTLFFVANDGAHGIELWALSIPPDLPNKVYLPMAMRN
jgi:ELWxxDGT repeat protein